MQLFASRDTRYRSPFGAVADGTEVLLRICLPREWKCRAAWLVHRRDDALEEWDGMFWAGMQGEREEWWDCRFAPPSPDLYWYTFAVDTEFGRRYFSRQPDGTAVCTTSPRDFWQLTCYSSAFATPDWLAGGVMYQIFPDRFCCSGLPKEGVPADRQMHAQWGEQPDWKPDASGVVHNNDFFGGDLCGIREKLPYLKKLGVTCLYINPIFESHSNHRYDTADYRKIDPLLGTEEDLRALTAEAATQGIRVLLDGVFSHTGADSVYFNKNGRYETEGAYQSQMSPYASWYRFRKWPNEYSGWWGFPTLPEVEELAPSFISYIMGRDGVLSHWLNVGASGWRLDVADELPDVFLEQLRKTVKAVDADALVLGEVWEDASNKQSYGHRRGYLLGEQLDSVMNYPFRTAILDFMRGGDAKKFFNRVGDIVENYPPPVTRLLMNFLGTHDTERVLTALAGEPANGRGRRWQSETTMNADQRELAKRRLMAAAVLQYGLPGVPCIYYGDEVGMEGYRDPFNRGCFPWGNEDEGLRTWFEALGNVRASYDAFLDGEFEPVVGKEGVVVFDRVGKEDCIRFAVNCSEIEQHVLLGGEWRILVGKGAIEQDCLCLPPVSGCILLKA